MRRGFAERRALKYADTCTVYHWTTRAQTTGGARKKTTANVITPNVSCRLVPRRGISPPVEVDGMEQPAGGTTIELPRGTVIAEDDLIVISNRTYVVIQAPPLRETDVYQPVEVREER